MNAGKSRVVVADDSALMRKKISEILNSDSNIEVVAVVKNGQEALDAVYSLRPDVVTLDIEMPVLNGIETLGYLMSECPTPCVIISAFTKSGSKETIRALELGAVDFVSKPGGVVISMDIDDVAKEIIEKVKLAAKIPREKLKLIWIEKSNKIKEVFKKPPSMKKVFALASSTGGTQALATIMPGLKGDLPAAVLAVQHMPEGFTKSLSERLSWQSKIKVVEAEDQMPISPGQVIIARGGMHMKVGGKPDSSFVKLSDDPPRLGVKPCADIMMMSAVDVFKDRVVGVVLTGMGTDGTIGAQTIKSAGGMVIAEHQSSCVIYGMPRSVIDSGLADRIIPLDRMAEEIGKIADDHRK